MARTRCLRRRTGPSTRTDTARPTRHPPGSAPGLFGRISARLRDRAERITRRIWLQTAIYCAGFIVLNTLLVLPLSWYTEWFREHLIRVTEVEADLFGLNAAREPHGFASAAMRIASYRKLQPTPLEEFVFFDHPSGRGAAAR